MTLTIGIILCILIYPIMIAIVIDIYSDDQENNTNKKEEKEKHEDTKHKSD